MKKLPLILVAAILALILTAGVVVAKVEVNKIEFNLDAGTYKVGVTVPVQASVVLRGNLREKDGDKYLSPLNGTIMIDGDEYNILVKAVKQSKPVISDNWTDTEGWTYNKDLQRIIVNVEGWKAVSGNVWWLTKSKEGELTEFVSSLYFWGTVDEVPVNCTIRGSFSIID